MLRKLRCKSARNLEPDSLLLLLLLVPQFVAIARVAAAAKSIGNNATQCWKIPALTQADAQHYDDLSKTHTRPHTHTHAPFHTHTHSLAAPKTVQLTSLATRATCGMQHKTETEAEACHKLKSHK